MFAVVLGLAAARRPSLSGWPPGMAFDNPSNLLQRVVIIEEYKLLFCKIEKVADEAFTGLLQHMTDNSNRFRWGVNTPRSKNWTKAMLEDALADPAWHKAVFFREPMERFLSGFRSKCEAGHDRDGQQHCEHAFGTGVYNTTTGFQTAVERLAARPSNQPMDEHWEHQGRFCGGLEDTLPHYNTVEQLDPASSRQKVIQLFKDLGVANPPAKIKTLNKWFPDQHGRESAHLTHAGAAMKQYYRSAELVDAVTDYYKQDYILFNISPPFVL